MGLKQQQTNKSEMSSDVENPVAISDASPDGYTEMTIGSLGWHVVQPFFRGSKVLAMVKLKTLGSYQPTLEGSISLSFHIFCYRFIIWQGLKEI